MTHPQPPHHPSARRPPRAEVLTLVADLSVIDRLETALRATALRPRDAGASVLSRLADWLAGPR